VLEADPRATVPELLAEANTPPTRSVRAANSESSDLHSHINRLKNGLKLQSQSRLNK